MKLAGSANRRLHLLKQLLVRASLNVVLLLELLLGNQMALLEVVSQLGLGAGLVENDRK